MNFNKKEMKVCLNNFLVTNFKEKKLKNPLFYNFEFGLRFNLQSNYEFGSNSYFKECIERSLLIFEDIFKPNDNVLITINVFQNKREKISKSNYVLKQIDGLEFKEINFKKYSHNLNSEIIQANIQTLVKKTNYNNLIKAVIFKDFPYKAPQITEEIFFVNIDKNIILKIYDDRGLDVVSNKLETLEPIFHKFNEWILDYDRKKIENTFKKNSIRENHLNGNSIS